MAEILLVDDEAADLLFLKTVFENSGHAVHLARNGEEAIRACLHKKKGIDVVVTDLVMPRGHGLELIDAIVAIVPSASIIAVTGKSPEALEKADELGADMVFHKPVDGDELLEAVAKLVKDRD